MSTQNFKLALTMSASIAVNAQLYAATPGTWAATGSLATARGLHTATLLATGKVLVAGGVNVNSGSSAELYDPSTGTWASTGSLATARYNHTATLLATGKVLVAGGYNGSYLNSAEVYDPTTGIWSSTGSLATARDNHTATLLSTGKVLVAGGYDNGVILTSAEVYDPSTGIWSSTGSLATARNSHTATLLATGKVLVTGGEYYDGSWHYLTSAELYAPSTGTWSSTGSLATARRSHTATLLATGKVLVAGGWNGGSLSSSEIYAPSTGMWSSTGSLATARYAPTATMLANGRIVVTGGGYYDSSWSWHSLNSSEVYAPSAGNWSATGDLVTARGWYTATLLPNEQVLVTGGCGDHDCSNTLSSAELYTPLAVATSTNLSASPSVVIANQTITFTATVSAGGSTGSPNGNVTFKIDGATVATSAISAGTARYATSTLSVGTHTVRADFVGTASFATSFAQLTQTVNPGADFTLTSIVLTPAVPALGSNFSAKVSFKNQGAASGNTGNVVLWLDQPTTPDCRATGDRVISLGLLAAGASTSRDFTGLTASAGSHLLRLFVDSNCVTLETNETNNQLTHFYRVNGGTVDFAITAVALTPSVPTTGIATFSAAVTVQNKGTKGYYAGFVDVWANQATAQTCGADSDAWADAGFIAAGASKTVTVNLPTNATAGNKTLRAFVDSWCENTEVNETNNQFTRTYTVLSPMPDFAVTNVMLTPASPGANQVFTAVVTVKNQATATGNGGYLELWTNQPSAVSCGARGDSSATVGSLIAGAVKYITFNTLSSDTAGVKTLRVFVDSVCTTAESIETNNQFTKTYMVQ